MKLKQASLCLATLLFNTSVFAHGYVESPPSRAYQCKLGGNSNCGSVQWEPQSVEQFSGFPESSTPPDGQLASAGKANYAQLDEQSRERWAKTAIKSGSHTFVWHHTAPHKTTNWRYYITKQDWNPNQPLTRSAFESKPFCEVAGNGATPAVTVTHTCTVPSRTGYQVIYAVWEIADTANSFYQAIDVDFGNSTTPASEEIWAKPLNGLISGEDLKSGNKVIAHFFNSQGEVTALRTPLTIASDSKGASAQWSYDLANAINAAHPELRAGVKDAAGNITPTHGDNPIYAKEGSELESMTIYYEKSAVADAISLSDVSASKITGGNATVTLHASAQGNINLLATVSDHAGTVKGQIQQTLENASSTLTIPLTHASAGHHMLRYYGYNSDGVVISQGVVDLMLEENAVEPTPTPTPAFNYVFPASFTTYKAGTRVLQPKGGKVYQCRPFPWSGYCVQWSQYATQFEPGVGSAWKMAWTVVQE